MYLEAFVAPKSVPVHVDLWLLQHTPRVLSFDVLQRLFLTLAPFVLVRFDVLGQVVTPHEPLAAVRAHEALLPSVSPQVSLQLVRPGEALATEEPVADKRPLARVPAQVRLQVRRFPVNFPAAGDVADVLLLLARLVAGRGGLAVGTPAASAAACRRQGGLGVQQRGDLRLVLRKVRVPQNQTPLELEAVRGQGGRVADVVALLQTPPRDVLPGVGGQLSLLLVVHQAGGSRHKTWHGGRDGSWRCVTDGRDVSRGAGGLHGAR